MSLITWRDRGSRGQPIGPVWYLEFDAATVEEFSRIATVTSYPVETGAILSDHYQPEPRRISLQGVVSDTPAQFYIPRPGKLNAAPPPIVTPLVLGNVIATIASPRPDRVSTFITVIDGLMENRIPVDVVIQDGLEYRELMITAHRAPRVSGSGGSSDFSLELQEVIKAVPAETTRGAAVRSEPAIQSKTTRSRAATKPPGGKDLPTIDKLAEERLISR